MKGVEQRSLCVHTYLHRDWEMWGLSTRDKGLEKGSDCRVQQGKEQTRDVINQGQGIKVQNITLARSVMIVEQMCCA